MGLDVRVLNEDNTEVEIAESVDYGNTDMRSILDDADRRYNDRELEDYGYTKQEFSEDEELVNVEEKFNEVNEYNDSDDDYGDGNYDDDSYEE